MDDEISIVGGGWSMTEVNHMKIPGQVIAVNDALIHLRCPIDYVVSMDRLWTEHRWQHLELLHRPTFVRPSCLKNTPKPAPYWLHTFACDINSTFFGEEPIGGVMMLNGRNSGACALNLAYALKPRKVNLFGFDMCRSPEGNAYWYPPYPWVDHGNKGATSVKRYEEWVNDFAHYAMQFRQAGIEVVNVSKHSKILSFKQISPGEIGCAL